jgi:hypothetical protein
MNVNFDLYLYEPEKHVRDRQYWGALLGNEIPRVGDLLELNEFSKVLHQKFEVVQVHRFYSSECEIREPRVYVKRIEP